MNLSNYKQIEASEVKVGDFIYIPTERKMFKIFGWGKDGSKCYNSLNVDDETNWSESKNEYTTLEKYVQAWIKTWNGAVEFYSSDKSKMSLIEMLEFAKTHNFSGEFTSILEEEVDFKMEDGEMFVDIDDNWKSPYISSYLLEIIFTIDQDSIVERSNQIVLF